MNILFLSLGAIQSIKDDGIYSDLLREFIRQGHKVCILSPSDRKIYKDEILICEGNTKIIRVFTGEIQKTSVFKKGINTILLEKRFINAIKRNLPDDSFDLVLYPTPPITLVNTVKYVKERDNAMAYLMLKDIFPQNAVDIGMMSKNGVTGLLYEYFRKKEKGLYAISDWIGCMSQANVNYVIAHNPEISPEKIGLCPNCAELRDRRLSESERVQMRKKYGLPLEKRIFVYGGNLGKPQGIPFLIECLEAQRNNSDAFFLVVGSGTEYKKLKTYFDETKSTNMRLLHSIPKEDYDQMIAACDVGMIFLDHRFTVPNFPSRLLSYMQAELPVLACTDPNTDIGKVIVDGGFGWWCESNDVDRYSAIINDITRNSSVLLQKGSNGKQYMTKHFTTDKVYKKIINAYEEWKRGKENVQG